MFTEQLLIKKRQSHISVRRNENGHNGPAMGMVCPALKFALKSLPFKFLPLLQDTNQLRLFQGKWLHHGPSSRGVSLVDSVPWDALGWRHVRRRQSCLTRSQGPVAGGSGILLIGFWTVIVKI